LTTARTASVLTRTLSSISQLEEINDHLAKLSTTTPDLTSPSMLRAIQRHRELYQDDMRELKRAKVTSRVGVVYPNPYFSTDGLVLFGGKR
jgi:hypothetical protein